MIIIIASATYVAHVRNYEAHSAFVVLNYVCRSVVQRRITTYYEAYYGVVRLFPYRRNTVMQLYYDRNYCYVT